MQTQPGDLASPTTIRDRIRRGEYLEAYDLAAARIESGADDAETQFLGVLALARAGATTQARRRYDEYGLGSIDLEGMPADIADDITVLSARLDKDEALVTGDGERATQSARGYEEAFERSRLAYHLVNAATMWLCSGDTERARLTARRALDEGGRQDDEYWDASTEAEAHLVLGDLDSARDRIDDARDAGEGRFSERARTVQQLALVCDLTGVDRSILDPLRNPGVAHYCGHLILPAGERGRFPAEDEGRVREALDRAFDEHGIGFGYGSLAAGADILAAEALIDRGAELHVVLPFPSEEFIEISVLPAGEHWVERFERCIAAADSVELATSGEYLGDPVLFDLCSRLAMGDALIRAQFLETDARQVAVWDRTPPRGTAGTGRDVERWNATGNPATIIDVEAGPGPADAGIPTNPRSIRAVVFTDYAGFSRLSDAQVLRFHEVVMGSLAEGIRPYRDHVLSSRTWGDAINLVFDDVAVAAECALDLSAIATELDTHGAGLGSLEGLRIAAHAAPLFEAPDPVSGDRDFFGVGMTAAARIEPRTPEGEIYTTHAFAALAMLEEAQGFECQYVGRTPTAKGYGRMPLYALRRRSA